MTDYKAIHGKNILSVASDLDSAEAEGEIWFNTTSGDYKTIVKVAGAWATGGNINTARYGGGMAGAAPSTGALIFGGSSNVCESYDGSSWTELADLNTARGWQGGAGSSDTAALAFGGENPPPGSAKTEKWNGTSWTEVNDLTTVRRGNVGTGTSTAALCVAGKSTGEPFLQIVETYDGTDWTETGDVNTARSLHGAPGTTTAGLAFGGASPYTAYSESFDG